MHIVFAGTPAFAAEHLRFLLDHGSCSIAGVLTQPDRPAGRGKKLTPSPVKALAEKYGLKVFQPSTLRDKASQDILTALKPDLMIVVAYGLILPQGALSLPRLGCINVHASLLPRWRGAAPIQRAIEAGDEETGITIMQMDKGLDTGDMLLKVTCPIDSKDTAATLHDKLLALSEPALLSTLKQISLNTTKPEKQDEALVCYAKKITKREAKIDWAEPANTLERKVRAFNPSPVAFFELDGEAIRVWRAQVAIKNLTTHKPGTIIESSKDNITVATGKGALTLLELQLPGKKPLPVSKILNASHDRFNVGKILSND